MQRPTWNQQEADSLVGLLCLVGIDSFDSDGKTLRSQEQYFGRIVSAHHTEGIRIACEGRLNGAFRTLPPDLRPFQTAKPGEYKLHSTGEVVTNPNLTCAWTVTEPAKSS